MQSAKGGRPLITAAMSPLQSGGSIAGRITTGGTPVRNMCVDAQNVRVFLDFGGAISNRNGGFDIHGLNSGTYELQVLPCGTGSNAMAAEGLPQLVHVAAPRRATGAKITAVRGATISGTVQARMLPAGGAAAGACVEAFATNGDAYNAANACLDGTFSITNLPPGSYRVFVGDPSCSLSEPNLAPQWYKGEASEVTATPVPVSLAGTTNLSDVTLADDGSISGSVTGLHGGQAGREDRDTRPGEGRDGDERYIGHVAQVNPTDPVRACRQRGRPCRRFIDSSRAVICGAKTVEDHRQDVAASALRRSFRPEQGAPGPLERAMHRRQVSARGTDRIIRMSWTQAAVRETASALITSGAGSVLTRSTCTTCSAF